MCLNSHRTAPLLHEHGFSREIVELLLTHTGRSQTAASYYHHELEADRRLALQYLAGKIINRAAAMNNHELYAFITGYIDLLNTSITAISRNYLSDFADLSMPHSIL